MNWSSWLEEERKSGASYFSWLVSDLTKWYLPPFLYSVNSANWHSPLTVHERRVEPIFQQITKGRKLHLTQFNQIWTKPKHEEAKVDSAMACYLPNGSFVTKFGQLFLDGSNGSGPKTLWPESGKQLVKVNTQGEIYYLDIEHNLVQVFDSKGKILKVTTHRCPKFAYYQLVGRELFVLEDHQLYRWNVFTDQRVDIPWNRINGAFQIAFRDCQWSYTLITDHQRYLVVISEEGIVIYSLDLEIINTFRMTEKVNWKTFPHVKSYYSNQTSSPNGAILSPGYPKSQNNYPIPAISPNGQIHLYYPLASLHLIIQTSE